VFCRTEGNFGQTGSVQRHLARFEHTHRVRKLSVVACLSSCCHEPQRKPSRSPPSARTATKLQNPRACGLGGTPSRLKSLRFKRNIIMEWRIASRVRASPARSAGLGWSSDSRPKLEWAMKNSERVARPRSVGKNLNSTLMRRGFSRYPYYSLSAAISSVQNCGEAPGARTVQDDWPSRG
jgi:hypothetical protein